MDDAAAGRAIRALRTRKNWRQEDLARVARVSQSTVSRAERGHIASLTLKVTRSMFEALDAGCSLTPWWRSGQLDRLLDEDHSMLAARAMEFLRRHGWAASVEVSFAVYSERGSIDLLATRRSDGAALVVEVKTRLMSVEELLRTLDRKARLATRIVEEREGWRPRAVGRLVVFGDDSTNRRRVTRASILDAALPVRGATLIAWLRLPAVPAAGAVFLSLSPGGTVRRSTVARQRVRKLQPRSATVARTLAAPRSATHQSPGD